ncbi:MAG: P-loop NTPase [Streptosporangiales bacterium]|nr:P-loop NTPase [Streptosporangiales bacterium]
MSLLGLRRGGVDATQVREALATVRDPEIGRTLDELGMLGDVSVDRRGGVRVPVALTTQECPLADEIRASVATAVRTVDGVTDVDVTMSVMDDRRRGEVGRLLHSTRTPLTSGLGGGPRVYAVASGKGGVGKSTVTANLAVALARSGQRVAVLDADVWGYSMPQLFGVRRAPIAFEGIMLPVPAYGVSLMSIGFFVDEDQPVVWRGPMLHKALQQFIDDVYWGEIDTLLVDLPPGTGDVALSVLQLLPDAALVVVTTPQRAARSVASRVGRLAQEAGMPIAGVVENMSAAVCRDCGSHTAVFGVGGGVELAEQVGARVLGQVPLDVDLREAGDRGVPAVIEAPDSASSVALRRVAETLPAVRRDVVRRSLPLTVV